MKARQRLESAAHVLLLGVLLAAIHPALCMVGLLVREFTKAKLPWPFKGQWPPGDPFDVHGEGQKLWRTETPDECRKPLTRLTQMKRVEDLRRDCIEILSGGAVGAAIHTVWVIFV